MVKYNLKRTIATVATILLFAEVIFGVIYNKDFLVYLGSGGLTICVIVAIYD